MPTPARTGELIGRKLGKYELLSLIALGGTAEIYLARIAGAAGFEKYLVVKCLLEHLADDQEFVRMFLDEARVGAQLDHSNIVQTLELGEHQGRYFLVMEHLAGMSLAQMARKTQERNVDGGLIKPNIVFSMAAQTCAGMHYAHEKVIQGKSINIVHRDISPQNLVVSFEGIVKIVDFGIAKSDMREAQTRAGTIKGKFAYMSPEQCLAQDVDRRTDVFALGTLCHELLTGRRLFKRQTTYDTYQAIINGGVPAPSTINKNLDAAVDTVIMGALAFDRKDRYPNAQAFGDALLHLLHKRGASTGSGAIARHIDQHFGPELQAHSSHMRQLVTGSTAEDTNASWDSDFGQGETRLAPENQASHDPVTAPPRDHYGVDDDDDDDDDDDEGPTRIEFDSAAKIADLHNEDESVDEGWGDLGLDSGPALPQVPQNLPPVPSNLPPAGPVAAANVDFATPPHTIDIDSHAAANPQFKKPPQGPPSQEPRIATPFPPPGQAPQPGAWTGESFQPPPQTSPVAPLPLKLAGPGQPIWAHAAAFLVFAGVGLGIALLIKMIL